MFSQFVRWGMPFNRKFLSSMAVFILEDALPVWANLGKHSLFVWLFVSSVKTGTRRIICLHELSSVVGRSSRTTEDSSSRRIKKQSVLINIFKKQFSKVAEYFHFWTFCKGYSKAKWLQKMVDFGNEVLINQLDDWSARMLRKLAQVNYVNTVMYSLDPTQFILFPRIW